MTKEGAAKFDFLDRYRCLINWESIDTFGTEVSGTGEVVPAAPHIQLRTGPVIDDYALVWNLEFFIVIMNLGKSLRVEFPIELVGSPSDQKIWLRLDGVWNIPPGDTDLHIGFEIDEDKIYASNADNVHQKKTDTGKTIPINEHLTRLRCNMVTGQRCDFYINDVLVASHSDYVPNMSETALYCCIRTLANINKVFTLGRVYLEYEY
jgi:hypothetical protein